jgi:FkbM family methyltransferase
MRGKFIAARIAFRLWPFRALPRSIALFRGLPPGTILSRKLFGYRFSGDVTRDSSPQRLLYLLGENFISEAALVRSLLRPGMRVIDVGANIGYYALMIAQCIGPEGNIIAIEPSPENLPELELNIRSNQISATVLPYAVSSHNRRGVGLRSGINSGIMEDDDAEAITHRVEQITLDTVVTGPVDFVKLDIEGYEYRALLGAQRLLTMRPTMFVEVHPIELRRNGSSARAVVELLSANYPNVTLYQQHQPSDVIGKVISSYGLNRIRQADREALLQQCDAGTMVIPFWAVATAR